MVTMDCLGSVTLVTSNIASPADAQVGLLPHEDDQLLQTARKILAKSHGTKIKYRMQIDVSEGGCMSWTNCAHHMPSPAINIFQSAGRLLATSVRGNGPLKPGTKPFRQDILVAERASSLWGGVCAREILLESEITNTLNFIGSVAITWRGTLKGMAEAPFTEGHMCQQRVSHSSVG